MLSIDTVADADVMQALAELAVEEERWEDAQQLVVGHPELAETVCLPWAEWLVAKGRFYEARLAYRYLTALSATLTQKLVCCAAAASGTRDAAQ